MSVAAMGLRALGPAGRGDPRWVIAGHVARSALRWAVIWGAVYGLFVIATIKAFVVAYPSVADRLKIAGSLQSFAILIGQPHHAETVAGFTQWRVLVVIALIGAIWGLLTSTGLLRGEEDAGRWELLLSGQTTKRRAATQALLGLGAAVAAMFGVAAALTLVAGGLPGAHFTIGAALLFAVAMVSSAAVFLAVGALASQLSATRGQAAMITAAVLGVSFVTRMVADSKSGLGWLRWFSPIGWVEEMRPLRDPQPIALVPVVAAVAVCAGLTVLLAGRRDLNASVLRERESGRGGARWLLGPLSLALRLGRGTALGWLAGIAGLAGTQGFVARAAATLLASSPAITATLGRLGAHKASEAYLGISFLTVAVLITIVAAGQIAAIRDEEAAGRLDNLLVRPVRRTSWLAGRVAISLGLVVVVGLAAGFFTWLGAASQHTGVSLATLIEAGINATMPAVFVLGAGVLVFGLRPRLSAVACYGIVAYSFLIDLLGSLIKGNEWIRDSSLFTHIALAPAAKPDWGEAAVVVLLGACAAVVGALAFKRRDVEYA